MHVIRARNVQEALVVGLQDLRRYGVERESRNGPVVVFPEPVTTVCERPEERVLFHCERDANPFFHLFEALWMLAGRNDLAYLLGADGSRTLIETPSDASVSWYKSWLLVHPKSPWEVGGKTFPTGSLLAIGLGFAGVGVVDQLLMSAIMCLVSAWLAQKLHRACD